MPKYERLSSRTSFSIFEPFIVLPHLTLPLSFLRVFENGLLGIPLSSLKACSLHPIHRRACQNHRKSILISKPFSRHLNIASRMVQSFLLPLGRWLVCLAVPKRLEVFC